MEAEHSRTIQVQDRGRTEQHKRNKSKGSKEHDLSSRALTKAEAVARIPVRTARNFMLAYEGKKMSCLKCRDRLNYTTYIACFDEGIGAKK